MDHWKNILKRFDQWGSPLRPCPEDVEMFKAQLGNADKVLLLGVTQELLSFATVAVDHNPHAIKLGGDKAQLADWAALPFEEEFDVAIGDGSLNVFQQAPAQFLKQIKKALKPKGRLILRLFISPDRKRHLLR